MADASASPPSRPALAPAGRRVPFLAAGLLVWGTGLALMAVLDGWLDVANLAPLLVLTAAVAALWLPPWPAVLMGALAVLAFNLLFVPPRGTLSVDLHAHAVLLATLLGVSTVVALLMARQRRLAERAGMLAQRADELRRLAEQLRDSDAPATLAPHLTQALQTLTGGPVLLLRGPDLLAPDPPVADPVASAHLAAARPGLLECMRLGQPLGPGTGRHEGESAWFLPLRSPGGVQGAAWLAQAGAGTEAAERRTHAQALCDQFALALAQADAREAARRERAAHDAQTLRNTLLASIAHDHRTPLATIVSAASALHDQADRLDAAQRRRLAATIGDEAAQLIRLTDNTLQLAWLGAAGLNPPRDWESVEELVGSVLRRLRQRHPGRALQARVAPGLPLVRLDAHLLVQLLDNLADNALRHGGDGPVELLARQVGERLLIAVRDRGPGVPLAGRERLFEPFARGDRGAVPAPAGSVAPDAPDPRGAGLGLALCQAIARAHGGELRYRPRHHGGAAFECWLPLGEAPEGPDAPDAVRPDSPSSPRAAS